MGSAARCVGHDVADMAEYPPPNHLLRDLRATTCWVDEDELQLYAPLQPAATDALGVQVGVIAGLVDIAGAMTAFAHVAPDWCATSDLSFQRSGGVTEGPVVISTKLLRAGGRVVTVRSEVFDGRGEERPSRHAGTAVMTFTRLTRDAARFDVDDEVDRRSEIGQRRAMTDSSSGFDESPLTKMGLRPVEPGVVELDKSPYVLNSFGTVNGGATAITLAAAAQSAVDGAVAADISVRYVGQAGVGPVRTVARELADYDSYASVDVELLDTSADDRLIALGTVGLVRE